MEASSLRKRTIGPFSSLGDMREAWNLLKAADEKMARKRFDYTGPYNLCYWSGSIGWGATGRSATITARGLKEFMRMHGIIQE